ncbi:MAG TPA: hypothetical protein PLQ35_14965 [bacterium]|nr:hypothetical protein [bacterium]HQL63586.1 hypothetical protein [bacterium]
MLRSAYKTAIVPMIPVGSKAGVYFCEDGIAKADDLMKKPWFPVPSSRIPPAGRVIG